MTTSLVSLQQCALCLGVSGSADDHAGHRNPTADDVLLPADHTGPPVATYTALPQSSEWTLTYTCKPSPAHTHMYSALLEQRQCVATSSILFFFYRLKRRNIQHTNLLLAIAR